MSKLADIQERRKKSYKQLDELRQKHSANGDKWPDAETEQRWQAVNAEYDAAVKEETELRNAAKVAERFNSLKEQEADDDTHGRNPGQHDRRCNKKDNCNRNKPDEETRAVAFQGWLRARSGMGLKACHKRAMSACNLQPNCRRLDVGLCQTRDAKKLRAEYRKTGSVEIEERALSSILPSTGAITVPDGFISNLEVNMLHYSGILQVADILRTDSGNDITWPTADDTSNKGARIGESADVTTSADPSFAAVTFSAYKYSSKMVKVPVELLEDSAFDMVQFLSSAIGERLGRILNEECTTGTGGAMPKGVVTAATLGKTTASSTAIVATEFIELFHSVDRAYRDNAYWMMADQILMQVRLLKDSQNRPLFLDNYGGTFYPSILGRPVAINSAMDTTLATTKKVALFGDFSKYKVRMVRSLRLRRLVERFADYDQEGFIGFMRADGNLLDAGTAPIKYLKMA